ncbi:rcc01693 family protein [Agrobacterium rubi]|uniref:Phage tail assembly chaperone n=1 Tax=Agrobacterium rubi TaxID=28099 RepID=A0AAE7R5D4_9HYPH|nr:rcc01693 family protein [Agrobacterium rubi]NTE85801.1 phage tail assembly chaperone [Agrobacterium rubi]NTF01733.1 phage tail assembly chaperone [Agrobacterium rubi]NTF35976.1 phage tail assembly chaperone [Agrobacterium rubi]QTG01651.1 phage tail assembly chaperone [Agrobacterium rubi]
MNAAAGADASQDARPFPWGQVIHAGLSLLRLSPTVFWALTPIEFFAMTGGMRPRRDELDRGGLEGLMRAFPDG